MADIEQIAPAQDVKKRGKIPYWMKNVQSTPDLVMRYQLKTRQLEDLLQADLRVLKEINQVRHFFFYLIYFLIEGL